MSEPLQGLFWEPPRINRRCRTPRAELDRYDTPHRCTRALLDEYPEIRGEVLLDPSSGSGRMAKEIGQRFARVVTNDLDPRTPADTHRDACEADLYRRTGPVDWIITNPPNCHAPEIAQRALEAAPRCGVALLLRGSFLEPWSSRRWLPGREPQGLLVLPREQFRPGGKDQIGMWWFIWSPLIRPGIRVRLWDSAQEALPLGKEGPARDKAEFVPSDDDDITDDFPSV